MTPLVNNMRSSLSDHCLTQIFCNQEEEEKIDDVVKEENKKVSENSRSEVKVEHAEPRETTAQSATGREEVAGQEEAGATPTHPNHVKARPPRSIKAASLTPVSAVSVQKILKLFYSSLLYDEHLTPLLYHSILPQKVTCNNMMVICLSG